MSKVLDVRKEESQPVSKIVFYEECNDRGTALAHNIVKSPLKGLVRIFDGTGQFILVENLEHASLLMKALKEAEKLGWFKV